MNKALPGFAVIDCVPVLHQYSKPEEIISTLMMDVIPMISGDDEREPGGNCANGLLSLSTKPVVCPINFQLRG